MTKPKAAAPDKRTQKQKFIDAAREHGADGDEDTFRMALKKIATASNVKIKKTRKPG